jgi:hypothetical protein
MVDKLVRDKTKQFYPDDDYLDVLYNPVLHKAFLINKLYEEIAEVSNAPDDAAEYGDVIEALYVLASLNGISPEKIENVRKEKAQRIGSFKEGIVWVGYKYKD